MAIITKGGVHGKVCSTCRQWKPLDHFHRDASHGDLPPDFMVPRRAGDIAAARCAIGPVGRSSDPQRRRRPTWR